MAFGLRFPTGAADRRDSICTRGLKNLDVLRLDTPDRDDWNFYRVCNINNERNSRSGAILVRRRFENRSRDDPRSAFLFSFARFVDAMNADSNLEIRRNSARFVDAKRMRRELNSLSSNAGRNVYSIIHYQPAAGLVLKWYKLFCEVEELSSGNFRASQLHGAEWTKRPHDSLGASEKIFAPYYSAACYSVDERQLVAWRGQSPKMSPTDIPRPRAHSPAVILLRPDG